ncbi:MAG: ribosome biogenesis GTPase YlqF, partial [Oscillospiraceae bacterium]
RELYPQNLEQRYKFKPEPEASGFELLEEAAKRRGFLVSKGEYDLERMSVVLLDEFRDGRLGRISLEKPQMAGETNNALGD